MTVTKTMDERLVIRCPLVHFFTVLLSFCRTLLLLWPVLLFPVCCSVHSAAAAEQMDVTARDSGIDTEKDTKNATTVQRLEHLLGIKQKKEKEKPVLINVSVTGIKDPLLKNVFDRLSLFRQRSNPGLNAISVTQLFRRGRKDIKGALQPFGYYNPQIKSTLTHGEKDGKMSWDASFVIDKGTPVVVVSRELRCEGEGRNNSSINKIISNFLLVKGDVLKQQLYESEKKKLLNIAIQEGYLDAAFTTSVVQVDPVTSTSTIVLVLNTGRVYRFGDTNLTTDPPQRFREKLLHGYLPYHKGDSYSVSALYKLQSILYQTDYFKNVTVTGHPENAQNGEIPVAVSLEMPDQPNKYTLGAGYATDTGARVTASWKNRMLNSSGDHLGAGVEVAEFEKQVYITWEKPRSEDPRYDHYLLSSSYLENEWDDTSTRQFSTSFLRKYSGPKFNLSGGLEFVDESYDVGSSSSSSGTATIVMPTSTFGFVLADDLINTGNGLRVSADVKGALDNALSDVSFLQWQLGGKVVLTPISRWRLLGRARFGATLISDIEDIPPSLRFYAGGDNSIRGYAYKSIGPTNSDGDVVGGKYLTVESVEVERLIGQYFGVAAFWDVGTATNDLSLDFHQGAGAGLRVRLPFGSIKLDLASAITESGYPLRVHLSVGGDL
ncbi:outer membrane protein assembly factor [Desulforhopalus vacuolatus]|uniref:autotransporter assembly complex protein TamA n=1 Tax=Desulforhopalus vacuolatus TaxID=40414 RepID=UPI00196343F3|nr:autotransporter assembly complex family protein [Desulforhopalus vacuolatus]MBM9518588.1 outer membrane protein assembly factor [Desulforhopalus vacuolatus]